MTCSDISLLALQPCCYLFPHLHVVLWLAWRRVGRLRCLAVCLKCGERCNASTSHATLTTNNPLEAASSAHLLVRRLAVRNFQRFAMASSVRPGSTFAISIQSSPSCLQKR